MSYLFISFLQFFLPAFCRVPLSVCLSDRACHACPSTCQPQVTIFISLGDQKHGGLIPLLSFLLRLPQFGSCVSEARLPRHHQYQSVQLGYLSGTCYQMSRQQICLYAACFNHRSLMKRLTSASATSGNFGSRALPASDNVLSQCHG